jgi:hypothetical protein
MFDDRSIALSRMVTVLHELIEAGRALEPIESPHHDRHPVALASQAAGV